MGVNRLTNGMAVIAVLAAHAVPDGRAQDISTALTIGAVSNALSSTLADFNNAITTAGEAIKGAGNSLQANAQNVIRDIDRVFGKNVNLTFDRMDAQQQALYRDAQRLTQQIRQATIDIASKTAAEARKTIYEADIIAYNALYSLPCRSQAARIVYLQPDRIRIGRDTAEVTLRGNFLSGPEDGIWIDGRKATVIARSATEIRAAVPREVAHGIASERSVGIRVELIDVKKSNLLLLCPSSRKKRTESLAVTLAPRRWVSLAGWIEPTSLVERTEGWSKQYESGADDNCDADRDITAQICEPSPWLVKSIDSFRITGKNGGGYAGPPSLSGDSCIKVPGRAKGKGYDRFPFGVKNCRGRGWTNWAMAYTVKTDDRITAGRHDFSEQAADQASWNIPYPAASTLREPRYRYALKANITMGDKTRVFEISDAQQLSGPISARLIDGTLTVSYDESIDN